jgi:uncharacterized membrane protein YraQ (UPF0718 family)
MFDATAIGMLGLVALLAGLALATGGRERLVVGLGDGWSSLVRFAPMVAISFLAAGLAQVLLPAQWIRAHLGVESGLRGIALAVAAGLLTPSGPFVSMPIAAALAKAGAGPGPVAAFVAGWGLLALHRLIAWEIPFLGPRLALLRYGVCVALPFAAGIAARALAR